MYNNNNKIAFVIYMKVNPYKLLSDFIYMLQNIDYLQHSRYARSVIVLFEV